MFQILRKKMLKKILILFITLQGLLLSSQLTKKEIAENDKLIEQAKREVKEKNLKPTIFGNSDTTIPFGGYSYHNINGKDYSEVAKANNWSNWSLPSNMDEQYEQYYRKKKIKNYALTILGSLLLVMLAYFLFRRIQNIKKIEFKESLGAEVNHFTEEEKAFSEKLDRLKLLLKEKIIDRKEYENKKLILEKEFGRVKLQYIETARSKIDNSIIKEKINQINLAYEQGILTEEERVLKLANLDQKRRTT